MLVLKSRRGVTGGVKDAASKAIREHFLFFRLVVAIKNYQKGGETFKMKNVPQEYSYWGKTVQATYPISIEVELSMGRSAGSTFFTRICKRDDTLILYSDFSKYQRPNR